MGITNFLASNDNMINSIKFNVILFLFYHPLQYSMKYFLKVFVHVDIQVQLIQNSASSVTRWRQCDIRIGMLVHSMYNLHVRDEPVVPGNMGKLIISFTNIHRSLAWVLIESGKNPYE